MRCYARAYILRLIGGFLMPDKSQNLVKLMFLQFFEDLDRCGTYNWGGAVLATLYRMLCRASRPGDKEIGGPLVLLQVSPHYSFKCFCFILHSILLNVRL